MLKKILKDFIALVSFPILKRFLISLRNWALGYHSMKFRHFPNIS